MRSLRKLCVSDGLWVLGDVHIVLLLEGFIHLHTVQGSRDSAFLRKSFCNFSEFWLSLRARGGAAGGGDPGAHQLPALLPCPTRGNSLCSCLWSSDEAVAAPVQPCTDFLCRTSVHGKSGPCCMCSVSKAMAPVLFHGVASWIPGAVSHKNWF